MSDPATLPLGETWRCPGIASVCRRLFLRDCEGRTRRGIVTTCHVCVMTHDVS